MPQLSNPKHEAFAKLVASGKSAASAYVEVGYSKTGATANASRLIANDSVRSRVDELRAKNMACLDDVVSASIADRAARVTLLDEVWHKLRRVIDARAAAAENADIPGNDTGMLAITWKLGRSGKVKEGRVDTGLLQEMRATAEQAARELGQLDEPDSDDKKATEISYEWQSSSESSDTTPGTAKADSMKAAADSRVIPVQ